MIPHPFSHTSNRLRQVAGDATQEKHKDFLRGLAQQFDDVGERFCKTRALWGPEIIASVVGLLTGHDDVDAATRSDAQAMGYRAEPEPKPGMAADTETDAAGGKDE